MVSNETAKVSMFGLTLDRSLFHTFFPPSACLFPQLLQHSAPHHLQGAALVLFFFFLPHPPHPRLPPASPHRGAGIVTTPYSPATPLTRDAVSGSPICKRQHVTAEQ